MISSRCHRLQGETNHASRTVSKPGGASSIALPYARDPDRGYLYFTFNQVLIRTRTHGSITIRACTPAQLSERPCNVSTPGLTVHPQSKVCLLVSYIGLHGHLVLQYYSVQRRELAQRVFLAIYAMSTNRIRQITPDCQSSS